MNPFDCIVVGSGHAGSCAALSARQSGCARVLVVDKCPPSWVGGNGYFTAGAHRTAHAGLADLLPLVCNVSEEAAAKIDIEPYTADEFAKDIMRLGDGRSDEKMARTVVERSREAVQWLKDEVGVPFTLSFNRQAYEVDGRQRFWGGMALSVEDGGKGLIAAHQRALKKAGVEIWCDTPAVEIVMSGDAVAGLVVLRNGERVSLSAPAVVLAAGGYEANRELRTKYLGDAWKAAKVRGTPYNTGDGFTLATTIGARLAGDWQGCHSTCWDANAPADTGDQALSNQFTKSGYPLGIMVNALGERFVNEGQDFRNYTYAKFGKAILHQPGAFAFQVYDGQVLGWLRKEEYADDVVEKICADTVEGLAQKLAGKGLENSETFATTVRNFNSAALRHREEHPGLKWDPAVKDGLSTRSPDHGLELDKTNWALPIDRPPFVAIKVACGITFTFGGLAIDPETASVLAEASGTPISGLYCTGEMVGGLFYGNYPGGSGLTAGAVFGCAAGRAAGRRAAEELSRNPGI